MREFPIKSRSPFEKIQKQNTNVLLYDYKLIAVSIGREKGRKKNSKQIQLIDFSKCSKVARCLADKFLVVSAENQRLQALKQRHEQF